MNNIVKFSQEEINKRLRKIEPSHDLIPFRDIYRNDPELFNELVKYPGGEACFEEDGSIDYFLDDYYWVISENGWRSVC